MTAAIAFRPLDSADWMTSSCNGQYWPVTSTPDDHTMHVPPTVNLDTRAHLPQDSDTQETSNPSRIRRRASQGSLRTRPSPVSRFLSKSSVAVNFPSWDQLRLVRPTVWSLALGRSTLAFVFQPLCLAGRGLWLLPHLGTLTINPNTPPHYPPTPPEEEIHVAWNPKSEMMLFDTHSHTGSMAMMDETPSVDNSSATGASDTLSSPSDGLSHRSSSSGGSPGPHDDMDCQQDIGSWLDHGIDLTASSLALCKTRGEAVKIVSQTLPYPRTSDQAVSGLKTDSVFSSIVQAVHNHLQPGQSPYINVTHAVPEQFSLSNLPHSPPSTPRSPTAAEEYFNATVFSSAAVVSAYHDYRGPLQRQMSHAPMPIVPPRSVHISVLERYLPPTSAQEYRDLFCRTRPSFLVDRMSELSPNGGSLLFVYPTKKGASTFKSQYLGPILDPLLRQLVVVNELSADVGRYLGKLSPVSQMDDFATMKANIAALCESLSDNDSSSRFHVADAGRGETHLDRSLWAEWFIHQEKPRMKEVLSLYWQNGRRSKNTGSGFSGMMGNKEVTSSGLLSEICDGIRKRRYCEDNEPRDGIELGVFVIRRTN
ncbi:hypothetical protein N7497_000214 [Penicillium chrysogenum]|nr:hypothetical protein N7497_000214 [Penicillium chrysogenum]